MADAAPPAAPLTPVVITTRVFGAAITLLSLAWGLQLQSYLGLPLFKEQFLATVVGCTLVVAFLSNRWNRQESLVAPWYDIVFAVVAAAALFYIAINWRRFLIEFPDRPLEMVILGLIATLTVMEALRRVTGWFLFAVVMAFIAYAMVGHLVPAPLTGRSISIEALVVYLGFDTNAMFGVPAAVSATIVLPYILLGQLLLRSGGGEFFTDLAMAAVGRSRGGAAKISVVASALFGSISGSAVSNVATTGVITIPLMRRSGYSAVAAGATEAVSSTGGQFMPPIMGAAAFLMAELLEIPYTDVIIAGIVPALLYYLAVFIQVDLVAAKERIKVIDIDLPRMLPVLKEGWHLLLPFGVLFYALFSLNEEAEIAALYAAGFTAIGGAVRSYKGHRLSFRSFIESFWTTGHIMTNLIVIVLAAGFVIGILSSTGLSFALTLTLVQLAQGQLWILLGVGALICIVLGMGMPTAPLYLLLALLVAPAFEEAGVVAISAHMFILYFGMMSMITPPIALAAFTAAAITKASLEKTGFHAMRLGWVAYVIPFLFVISPTIILLGETGEIINDIASAAAGVYLVSVGVVGYLFRPLPPLFRVLIAACGMLAMIPDIVFQPLLSSAIAGSPVSVVGAGAVLLGLGFLGWEYTLVRRSALVAGG